MKTKINQLLQSVPPHTLVTQSHLSGLGISRALATAYVRSGWLERLAPGVYQRAGDSVPWQGGLYALQTQLQIPVHVAAVSALELSGYAHFLPMGSTQQITLAGGQTRPPKWFMEHNWNALLSFHQISLYDHLPAEAIQQFDVGGTQVSGSTPENALLEMIYLAGNNNDFEHVHTVMRSLTMLRPSVVQALLESCHSVKVKRFFLWCADCLELPWYTQLSTDRIDLGRGKRQLVKNGKFNSRYGITVFEEEALPSV